MLNNLWISQYTKVSFFGDHYWLVALPVCIIISIYLYKSQHKKEAFILVLSQLSPAYALFLKYVFKEQRPLIGQIRYHNVFNSYSFPSSHVVFYMAFWGFLAYLCFKLKKIRIWLRALILTISMYHILLVGISRVELGAHWPKDVIAGYLFGAIYLTFLIILDKKIGYSMGKNKNKDN